MTRTAEKEPGVYRNPCVTGPNIHVALSLSLRDQMIKERLVLNGHDYRVPAFLHSTDTILDVSKQLHAFQKNCFHEDPG